MEDLVYEIDEAFIEKQVKEYMVEMTPKKLYQIIFDQEFTFN